MDLQTLLPAVETYLQHTRCQGESFTIAPLAQGEYNLNYLVRQNGAAWVLRVNLGTQIQRDDQIAYEYRALCLLAESGVTPRPHFVDDSRIHLPYGVLGMEYLPGGALDYRRDLESAARLFARVHTTPVPAEDNPLICETRPLSMTYDECARLLPVYLDSSLAAPALSAYLADVLAWAAESRHAERYFAADPCPCIINTEVNSGNFIANRERDTLHLVDWEKPLYGDPSQDLSHFCAPMTTLWKSDYRMNADDKRRFLETYKAAIPDPHLRDTLDERVRLRDPFNYLRGISWSAMAWVTYQTGDHAVRNEDTFQKITAYLDLTFLRGMFDDYMRSS